MASTYFETVRSMTDDPVLLRAIDRTEFGTCPTCHGKGKTGRIRRSTCWTCSGSGANPARVPLSPTRYVMPFWREVAAPSTPKEPRP